MATIQEHFEKYKEVIDLKDLKIKHISGIYKQLPNSPNADDILYFFFVSNKKSIAGEDLLKHFGDEKLFDIQHSLEFLKENNYIKEEINANFRNELDNFEDFLKEESFNPDFKAEDNIDEEKFKLLFPKLTEFNEKVIITCIPVGANYFYEEYKRYEAIEKLGNSKFILN